VGRALINGAFSEYFGGAVDDVRVYAGVVDDQTVANLATRSEKPNL
jgi:phage gp37-like protein